MTVKDLLQTQSICRGAIFADSRYASFNATVDPQTLRTTVVGRTITPYGGNETAIARVLAQLRPEAIGKMEVSFAEKMGPAGAYGTAFRIYDFTLILLFFRTPL